MTLFLKYKRNHISPLHFVNERPLRILQGTTLKRSLVSLKTYRNEEACLRCPSAGESNTNQKTQQILPKNNII